MEPIGSQEAQVAGRYRTLLIMWCAILFSVGIFFFLTRIIPRSGASSGDDTLTYILTGLGAFLAIFSMVVRQKILAQAIEKQRVDLVASAYVVAFALSETASIFGVALYLITAPRFYYLLFMVSVIGMLLNFPRRDDLVAASSKNRV